MVITVLCSSSSPGQAGSWRVLVPASPTDVAPLAWGGGGGGGSKGRRRSKGRGAQGEGKREEKRSKRKKPINQSTTSTQRITLQMERDNESTGASWDFNPRPDEY